MKYVCEVCGCSFDSADKCKEHEDPCKQRNQRVLFINNTINDMIESAYYNKVRIGAEFTQQDGSKVWRDAESAVYTHSKNTVQINFKPEEVADAGKVKSGAKKVK